MEQYIVWNYYNYSPQYLLRIGMKDNEIIFQCLRMKKFEANEILESKIPKDEVKEILESNKDNKVFFINLNYYDITYDEKGNKYLLYLMKNKKILKTLQLEKQIGKIGQEFKKNYIEEYKKNIERLKKSNESLENELNNIKKKNEEIKKINEDISKDLEKILKKQNESINLN